MDDGADLRAGDADRDRTISLIREAYTEGRLDNDEFEARMGTAQQARTYGELAALVRDLPVEPPTAAVAVPSSDSAVPDEDEGGLRKGWAAWAGVSIMVNVIWLGSWVTGSGDAPGYWPIWVMGPWGAGMVIATINRRVR